MLDLKEQIDKTNQEIIATNELLYQQKIPEGMAKMGEVLTLVENTMEAIYAYHQEKPELAINESLFMEALKEALAAMEEADYILVADIFQYDIVEKLEEVKEII